jgi:hypothetical protein
MPNSITLTLGTPLGSDLGPNFNLTTNVGSVTPSTATRSELLAGKIVSVDDLATNVIVTSIGTCTNSITQTIPCGGTTTTTTTGAPLSINYLVVAGGGASGGDQAGGGGAGGLRSGSISITPGTYNVIVGGGGITYPQNGKNSSIAFASASIAIGGGAGQTNEISGKNGGSGGGGGGNTVDILQGNRGGGSNSFGECGGGGGSFTSGSDATFYPAYPIGGAGGSGSLWINGLRYAGGGGGGSAGSPFSSVPGGLGGPGGGGNGGNTFNNPPGTPGVDNTGGGGGGGFTSQRGGSGIVIIAYLGGTQGTGGTISYDGTYTYHTFTSASLVATNGSGSFIYVPSFTTTAPISTTTSTTTTTAAPFNQLMYSGIGHSRGTGSMYLSLPSFPPYCSYGSNWTTGSISMNSDFVCYWTGSVVPTAGSTFNANRIVNGVTVPGVIYTPADTTVFCFQSPLYVNKIEGGITSSLIIFPNTSVPVAIGGKIEYYSSPSFTQPGDATPPAYAITGSSYTLTNLTPYFNADKVIHTFTSSGNFYYNTFTYQ